MIRVFRNTGRLIFKKLLLLFVGQIILIAFYVLLITPFINNIFRLALNISGYSYITVSNLVGFLLHPINFILMLVMMVVLGILIAYEMAFLSTFFSTLETNQKVKLLPIYQIAGKQVFQLLKWRNILMLPWLWLMVMVCNFPIIMLLIKRVRLFNYGAETISGNYILTGGFWILVIILMILYVSRMFVFPYQFIDRKGYKEAVNLCRQLKLKKRMKNFSCYFLLNVITGIISYTIYFVVMCVTVVFIVGIPSKTLAIATFISMNEKMIGFFLIGMLGISLVANSALSTQLFYSYKREEEEELYHFYLDEVVFDKPYNYRRIWLMIIATVVLVNIYFLYGIIKDGTSFAYMNLDKVKITSHRGFSYSVPENTIPAIEKAMEEQADFIEIDVRQTKDGKLVLLHDVSLDRTTGLNKKIYDVNYDEISDLDAGIWMDEFYKGVKIPTLREAFDICKGRVNINLDIKKDYITEDIEEKVVELIEEYDMEVQCVISCTRVDVLQKIKDLNPNIKTGYITSQVNKIYYKNKNIDFFSVKSYFVSQRLTGEIHSNGKELHVWTVNSIYELERMKRLGVDNVITDNPARAREILYQKESGKLVITFLKLMIEY